MFDASDFIAGLEGEARRRMIQAAAKASVQFAEHVIGQAQMRCPVSPSNRYVSGQRKEKIKNPRFTGHSGNLKNSATVGEPVMTGNTLTIEMGFNADYAAAVHERLDQHHDQGEAKYLERAMRAEERKFESFVANEVRKALG